MDLVERDEMLAVIDRLFRDCCQGNGKVAVISGPVGIGKTELLHAVATRMRGFGAHLLYAGIPRAEYGCSLGAMDQLLRNASLPRIFVERMTKLLDTALGAVAEAEQSGMDGPARPDSAVIRGRWHTELWDVVRELADDQPVVVIIDDAHNLDSASQECLLYLLRRLRMARIFVLLGERAPVARTEPEFRAELSHELQCRFVELAPLSGRGVAKVLTAELGHDVDDALVAACHEVTGGNPRLVRALAEDCVDAGQVLEGGPRIGGAFRRAIEDCLVRSEPSLRLLARGVAVVGDDTSPSLLSTVLDMPTDLASDGLIALRDAGLLDGPRFRHRAVRAVVLHGTPAGLRKSLHTKAAAVLHEHGAPAIDVARQLVAAGSVPSATMARVLYNAAGQTIAAGEPGTAAGFLRLAHRSVTGTPLDAAITSALAWAEWQLDPAAVVRHIPNLLAAFEAGQLDGHGVVNLFAYLLWHGRVVDARNMLETVRAAQNHAGEGFPDTVDVQTLRSWLVHLYPRPDLEGRLPDTERQERVLPSAVTHLHRHDGNHAENALVHAEQILHTARMDDVISVSITAALVAMVYSDRFSCAMSWCDDFLEEAALRRTKTWQGLLAALGSIMNFRQGRLETASTQARKALLAVPARSWGIAVGLPLAGGLLAATAADDHQAASAYLDVSVPDVMFKTPFAVHYLHARGRYLLANDHFHAALGDFLACGELMRSWNIDTPTFVPWRSDAAQAYLGLGQPGHARQLVDEQLIRLPPGNPRAKGVSLRVRAMTEDVADRLAPLREATSLLHASGDRLELALAFADLSQAHYVRHEYRLGSKAARRARELAKQCGARNLLRTLPPETGRMGRHDIPEPRASGPLSGAEHKVAALATRGFTNRQISNRLHVTVSTVEQHLTRIYRKLDVAGRSELSRKLGLDSSGGEP